MSIISENIFSPKLKRIIGDTQNMAKMPVVVKTFSVIPNKSVAFVRPSAKRMKELTIYLDKQFISDVDAKLPENKNELIGHECAHHLGNILGYSSAFRASINPKNIFDYKFVVFIENMINAAVYNSHEFETHLIVNNLLAKYGFDPVRISYEPILNGILEHDSQFLLKNLSQMHRMILKQEFNMDLASIPGAARLMFATEIFRVAEIYIYSSPTLREKAMLLINRDIMEHVQALLNGLDFNKETEFFLSDNFLASFSPRAYDQAQEYIHNYIFNVPAWLDTTVYKSIEEMDMMAQKYAHELINKGEMLRAFEELLEITSIDNSQQIEELETFLIGCAFQENNSQDKTKAYQLLAQLTLDGGLTFSSIHFQERVDELNGNV